MSSVLAEEVARQRRSLGPDLGLVAALAAAVAAVSCLLFGLSYPGFPMATAFWGAVAAVTSIALVVVAGLRALLTGRGRAQALVALVLVAVVFTGGVLAARGDDGARLQARWAASQPAFEQELLTTGGPAVGTAGGSGSFGPYQGDCPPRLGKFRIVDCRSIDGGFLFLQTQNALTDDSGLVYLPASNVPSSEWWSTETMTPLGGPWWSWTCHC